MRYDYGGRMGVWFKTLLICVVFNQVNLYRQLKNTTCLELAKSSNQHVRLSCNDSSTYHCLLNGDSTKEFEICKTWKWIPKGNCAYLNAYGWNIDARSCSSSADLACPKMLYRSEDTIKYAACYVQKNTDSTASPSPTASNVTSSDGNGGNASSSRISETKGNDMHYWHALTTILGIVVPPVSIAVIYFILKYVPSHRKDTPKFILSGNSGVNEDVSSPNARKAQRKYKLSDDGKEEENEEKSADSTSDSCSVSEILVNIRKDEEEPTDLFADTEESLQWIAPPI